MEYILHTSFPDELKNEWNELLQSSITNVPFLRYEYLEAWWQTRGGGEWPQAELAIVTAHHDGKLAGVAPLFAAEHDGKTALMLLGSIEVSDYLDVLVQQQYLDEFLAGLLPFLRSGQMPAWQRLDWYNLPDDSALLPAIEKAAAQLGWSTQLEKYQPSPYISLPGDWDAYLAGIDKKQRHEIRRKIRRLESGDVPSRWYIVASGADIEQEAADFLALMEQEGDKATFLTDEMRRHMRLTMRTFYEMGILHLSFLEIDGQKAAAKLCFDEGGRLMAYNSGIDRRFMEYSPGWVLLGYLLEWANHEKRREFDFMRGNEEYKYRFGALDRFVMRLLVSP